MKQHDSLGKSLRNPRRLLFSSAPVFRRSFTLFLLVLPLAFTTNAAQLKEARVSQVIKDVKLLPAQAAPRPAAVSDPVRNGTAVRTGVESRAELTFTDQTLARLGANTIFSFNEGTRNLDLGGGAMLLRVPKNAGGAQINTAAVTAAITGTTILLEYHPNAYIKFIVLEGTGRIFRKDHVGESVLVHAGQMLIVNPKAKNLPDPVDVDVKRLMETSLLITEFGGLGSSDLIAREIQTQLDQKSNGGLVDTNLVIFGRGTVVSLLDPTNTNVVNQANSNSERQPTPTPAPTQTPSPSPTASPTPSPSPTVSPTPSPSPTVSPTPSPSPTVSPTPSPSPTVSPSPSPSPTATPGKYGTLTPISSPVPYVISSGTTIATDPTITTNGVTDFGKIYRGPADDGLVSTWLFTATSPFDTQIGIDAFFSASANLPLAALKFIALSLTGNPTISIANGGPTKLALVSVGDITSGPPGGTLTFSGLDLLLLATQNGSITLTSDLAFQDIPYLGIYARGAESTLTLDSTISGTTDLAVESEGSILFNNAFSLTETNVSGSQLIVDVQAGADLTANNGFTTTLDNSFGGVLAVDAGVNLVAGGNMTLNGGNGLGLTISNNDGGHIVGNASLTVSAGGDLTASAITLLINNRNSGLIDGNGLVSLSTGGAITTTGDATFVISGRDDGGGPGVISGNASVVVTAGSVNVGGLFLAGMSEAAGGQLASALATINVAGDVTTGSGLQFSIQNGGFDQVLGVQEGGGTINQDALASFTANNVTIGDFFAGLVSNLDGGQIGGTAELAAFFTGDVNAQGDATFQIDNSTTMGTLTSTIGSDAAIGLVANNFTAGSLLAQITNEGGGSVGGNATIGFGITQGLTSIGDVTFEILNDDNDAGFGGGTVGGDATITVTANTLSAASLLAQIDNTGGTIGGNSTISVTIGGALTTTGDATFAIFGSSLTMPGAAITASAGSFNVGGSLTASIADGETAFNIGSVTINATNDITVGNQIIVAGSVGAGGNISATNGITITGGSLTAGGDITSSAGAITQSPSAVGEIGTISAGGNIFAAGGLEAFYFNTSITAGGSITASDAAAVTLQAGTDMTIGQTTGLAHFIDANTITAGGALSLINVGTIQDETFSSFGDINFTPDPFTLTASSISGAGPAIASLIFDGFAADPNFGNDNPGNGGMVTLNLTVGGLTIGSAGDIASITASGGAFASDSTIGGNGGTVNINATGDVNLTDGNIIATSGILATGGANTIGDGGTVNVTTSGAINVSSAIQTSSDDVEGTSLRRSAKGGNINLTSNKATGVAINVTNSAQLLALLDAAAPGPGGTITIVATGASSTANVQGTIEADRGTVDIHHNGDSGVVNISGVGGTNSAFIRGDIVKIGALGNNGILTIGQGTLSADSMLQLYANGSNGQILFVDNVTIGGGSATIIAGNTVTINNTKTVTVTGTKADVYTGFNGEVPNANYTGSGGNGSTSGMFGGLGANNPQPISNAPPFKPTHGG
jgi:acrosin